MTPTLQVGSLAMAKAKVKVKAKESKAVVAKGMKTGLNRIRTECPKILSVSIAVSKGILRVNARRNRMGKLLEKLTRKRKQRMMLRKPLAQTWLVVILVLSMARHALLQVKRCSLCLNVHGSW